MNTYEAALREIETLPASDPFHAMVKARQIARKALAVSAPPSAQEVEAGEFAEWTSINDWDYNSSQERWCQFMHIGEDDAVYYTTTALINLFKQSKTDTHAQ